MDTRYKKKEDEHKIDYLLRLCEIKLEEKPIDLEWQDIVDYCGFNCHYDSLRKAMQPSEYGGYAIYKFLKDNMSENEIYNKLCEKEKEVNIQLRKLRDLKLADREVERTQSRKESILEEIRLYMDTAKPLEVRERKYVNHSNLKAIGGTADAHFGKDIVINGINGEPLNIYNEEVFEHRMWMSMLI